MLEQNIPVILSIETSGTTCGVALSFGSEIAGDYSIFGRNLHDRLLAENIRRILSDFDMKLENIDAVAVSAGPGSFTGLRIGAAAAKGICFENHPRLIAVPTLSAIASAASSYAHNGSFADIVPIVHAHKDLVYAQKFALDGSSLSGIMNITFSELESVVDDMTLKCGPGAETAGFGRVFPEIGALSAKFIARLAYIMFLNGEFAEPATFSPVYVQEFEPIMRKKSH